MSDRQLLDELLDHLDNIPLPTPTINKIKAIRQQLATQPKLCQYEFPKYYCELEMYDSDCSHCTDKLECFKPKKERAA